MEKKASRKMRRVRIEFEFCLSSLHCHHFLQFKRKKDSILSRKKVLTKVNKKIEQGKKAKSNKEKKKTARNRTKGFSSTPPPPSHLPLNHLFRDYAILVGSSVRRSTDRLLQFFVH